MFRKIRTAMAILGFVVCTFLCSSMLKYMTIDDADEYTRIMLHELYYPEKNIDVLFIGSSHSFCSIDTRITDTMLDANTFNAASGAQLLDGSYALLCEAGKRNRLSHVFVEVFFSQFGQKQKDRQELSSVWRISDYMKPSMNKFRYLVQASKPEHYLTSAIPARRLWRNLFDIEFLTENLAKKSSEAYKQYDWVRDYAGKGFIAIDQTQEELSYVKKGGYPPAPLVMSEDDQKNIERIIQYCKNNNIGITFYTAPMPDFRLIPMQNYDEFNRMLNGFFEERGIDYYDFNLCKYEYFDFQETNFMDDNHLNCHGAEKFSRLFCRFVNGEIEEEALFYPTYEQKVNTNCDKLFGLILREEDENLYCIEPVKNGEMKLYYSVSKMPVGGGENSMTTLQENSDNPKIQLPSDEKGTLLIKVYNSDGKLCGDVSVGY